MKWMKFTDFEGDTVWLNMARAESFYVVSNGTRIVFTEDRGWTVTDTIKQIIDRLATEDRTLSHD